jgi:hypothetical protein
MSHHFSPDLAQIDEDPRERTWFARLVAPEGGSTPTTIAFLLGALGTAGFIGSLASDWVTVSLVTPAQGSARATAQASTTVDLAGTNTSVFVLGLVYSAGVVALIAFLGTVINRPEVALRSRMGAAGLGVGLLGVVIGSVLRLPTELLRSDTTAGATTVGYQAGMFYAVAATVLPVVGVWFAASPAARAVADAHADAHATALAAAYEMRRPRIVEPEAPAPFAAPRPIFAQSGPVDLTVIPDDDRRRYGAPPIST